VSLDHLWAGWRSSYVSSFEEGASLAGTGGVEAVAVGGKESCVFCSIMSSPEPDEARHVLWTGKFTVALLNAYPYSPGHVMVLPIRHLRDLPELEPEESDELGSGVRQAAAAVRAAYRPEGMNIGLNLGRAAGAGIPAHLHVHIVPRWIGDTNFMTSVAGVRVLPEALSDSWAKLRAAWK
jgi:ATP adenylyltransferase